MTTFLDSSGFKAEGHLVIRSYDDIDTKSGEVLELDRRNAVHPENMSLAMARSLAGLSTGHIYTMHFGTGGATVDALENIVYQTPNTTGAADLNTPVYSEVVDAIGAPIGNSSSVKHVAGTEFSDVEIRCLIDKNEPPGQATFDNVTSDLSGTFVFDEIGLKTNDGLLLTHVTFNPIQKTANRVIEVEYTIRIRVVQVNTNMAFQISNTSGSVVATVDDLEADVSSPLTLVGRGYLGYTSANYGNLWALMENFSNTTAPTAPAEGMWWYDKTVDDKRMSYYDGSAWVQVATASTVSGMLLPMLGSSLNVDFTSTGSTNLHTAATSTASMITGVLLLPKSGIAPTGGPAKFTLEVTTDTGDVMESVQLTGLDALTEFAYFPVFGVQRQVAATETVKVNVITASGGTLACDVFLFGHVRSA